MSSMFRSPFDVSSTSSETESSGKSYSSRSSSSKRTLQSTPVAIPERKAYGGLQDDSTLPPQTGRPKAITRLTSALNMSSLPTQQKQGLLQIALLEARCLETTWIALNKDRRPDQLLRKDDPLVEAEAQMTYAELVPAFAHSLGLPDELTGPAGKQLRQATLSGLDNILINTTSARVTGIEMPQVAPQLLLQTVPPQNLSYKSKNDELYSISDSFKQVALGNNSLCGSLSSVYRSDHQELCMLGKGGYGQVWKVKNYLDNQFYAVKKIAISSQRLKKHAKDDQTEALLEELRTLAKLHHTNVVRYYNGWIERSEAPRPETGNQGLLEGISTTNSLSRAEHDVMTNEYSHPGVEDIDHSHCQLGQEFPVPDIEDECGVVFGDDSCSSPLATHFTIDRDRRSRGTNSSARTFTKASLLSAESDDEDSDVENISRSLPKSPSLGRQVSLAHMPFVMPKERAPYASNSGAIADVTLYIKMSLHPTTLSTILSPDSPRPDENIKIRHCFHQEPSLAMISAILDGIEYLHSQRIVHRDLKPANIFLSVDTDRPPATSGFVDLVACPQCAQEQSRRIYLTPCIGDFGLIAEMKDPIEPPMGYPYHRDLAFSSIASLSDSEPSFEPSSLAELRQKHRPVGTQFYRPAKMPRSEPRICPKLDIYSLGVISFELIYKFGTRTERAILLNDLSQGKLPCNLDVKMAEGIRGMICEDRDTRWGCKEVRQWLATF